MSTPLHCYTAEAWLGFSNSWCLLSGNDLDARVKREQPHLFNVQAISISFDLFSLLCHDCLVGGNACCGVFGVLPHGWPVAIPHNIHLMWVACTHNGLWCITFFIIQATCIWFLLMCHSMKTLLYLSF